MSRFFTQLSTDLDEHLSTGDPYVREWFLVKSNFWPIFLSFTYLLIVKVIGPAYMKHRKPFELRYLMLSYNLFLVVTYAICILMTLNCIREKGHQVLCDNLVMLNGGCEYKMYACAWVIYLLKYVEFFDTIFFVMRKKDKLITNLHVIHHTILPLFGWVMFRTERSGFQAYPIIINSIVHVIMYTYYGLAALGPSMQKYLWWKKYLTIAQMTQFVTIITFILIIMPLSGCSTTKYSSFINLGSSILFLALFYNFYQKTFTPRDCQTGKGTFTSGSISNEKILKTENGVAKKHS